MNHEVLGSLLKDHHSMRAMRRVFAEEIDSMAQRRYADPSRLGAMMNYALYDSGSRHHVFERFLVHRLVERCPGAKRVTRGVERYRYRLERQGGLLKAWVGRDVNKPLRRFGFIRLARNYLARHEKLLCAEEKQVFPLLRDGLTPSDWVDATTAFGWCVAPEVPRNLIASPYDARQGTFAKSNQRRTKSEDVFIA